MHDWKIHITVHWDNNPWTYKYGNKYQSIVALKDCDKEGSFACIPGSHKYIHEYARKYK